MRNIKSVIKIFCHRFLTEGSIPSFLKVQSSFLPSQHFAFVLGCCIITNAYFVIKQSYQTFRNADCHQPRYQTFKANCLYVPATDNVIMDMFTPRLKGATPPFTAVAAPFDGLCFLVFII